MHTAIWEYLTPSPEEQSNLWEKCVFVFDANVLLNLYRYTSATRDTLLNALYDLKARVWLPYQVAYEFAKNRSDVIYETIEKYNSLQNRAEEFVGHIASELRLKPDDKSIEELRSAIKTWVEEQQNRNLLVTRTSEDAILDRVLLIFDGKVGKQFSKEEEESIRSEGRDRYERQIPPGFCDAKKEKGDVENNAYGDLIAWKQILVYSSDNKKDIIYITHDQKKDWWFISKGRTVGPRVELRREFAEKTGQDFYMYSMERFLELYSSHRGQEADQRVIDEVVHIEKKPVHYEHGVSPQYLGKLMAIEDNLNSIRTRLERRARAINNIYNKYGGKPIPSHIMEQLDNTEANMVALENELVAKQREKDLLLHQLHSH